jgi:hypothetical protein
MRLTAIGVIVVYRARRGNTGGWLGVAFDVCSDPLAAELDAASLGRL